MKLSSKGRYGTRVLIDIARHEDGKPILLRDVAERQSIPLSYLKRLIARLVGGGILRSMRGVGGGVLLARHPQQIKLQEVLGILEGSTPLVECISNPAVCERSGWCAARDTWAELEMATSQILETTTLQDLVKRQEKKLQATGAMYHI